MNSIWYPFTQMKTSAPPLKVVRGFGTILELENGGRLIDAISSWWVNVLGHGHPAIAEAICTQAKTLEHVIFAGFTHQPAELLAQNLVSLLPSLLQKVFFSDNGSTALEVALKMAFQHFKNRGEKKEAFICFDGAYHGDTIGAMSLSGSSPFNRVFEKLLFEKKSAPFPETYPGDDQVEKKEAHVLEWVDRELSLKNIAAVVIEPLVQGVAGMKMCRPIFLQKLQKLVKGHGSLLIYDEVMTGFGRTGDWFACLKSQTEPDIICLAKGLTGGFLPLAVTVCSSEIFNSFLSCNPIKTFFHGHSYTANPLGCAAANATLAILKSDPSVFQKMEERHLTNLKPFQNHPFLKKVRSMGTIVAIDVGDNDDAGYFNQVGEELKIFFLERGVLIRPLGNVWYLMPPYCITDGELAKIYETLAAWTDIGISPRSCKR